MSSDKFLEKVKKRIEEFVDELGCAKTKELHLKLPQGKMLRSKLVLATAGDDDESILLSSIIELIHAASLLHDDVIDDALTRRGYDSINSLYGNKSAIMLGDILYSKAYFELTKIDLDIARIVSNAVTSFSIGELLDVELSKSFNPDIKKYLDMIYKKTASLIEATSESAAIISGKNRENFKSYGRNLGIAFQIVDDILDITQDSATLGKPALNDLREGKTTIPYIYLYERLDEKEKQELLAFFGREELSEIEIVWIKERLQTTKALQDSILLAKEYGKKAIESIANESCEKLVEIVAKMIEREY